jgi:uncharacterized LabA/DUF88 family protein
MRKREVYAFIDSQNLNLGVKSQGWRLDFARFRVYLSDKYQVRKAYLFIGLVPTNNLLYADLQLAGFILIFKPVLEVHEGKTVKIKGNVDAELVLHTMRQYQNFSQAVIVSGDGDFYCLIEYLAERNKLKKIIVPNRRYSSLLRKYSSYIVNIDILKGKLRKRN